MLFIVLSVLCAISYLILQSYYIFHWTRTTTVVVPITYTPQIALSIIIVARNAEKTIEDCIKSIFNQQYPEDFFELIIIDDRSEDGTESIIKKFNNSSLQFFRLNEYPNFIQVPAFKKSGIELGVSKAKHEFIIVTDADCNHHPEWLRTIAYSHSQSGSVFYTAPVQLRDNNQLLVKMQQMETYALMMVTAAGIRSKLHDIANGANMAFLKKAFIEVGGYHDNYQYASGDDMFLIEKMRKRFPDKINFIKAKNATVWTDAKPDWDSLIKQRIRWSGKNKGLKNPAINIIWQFVGLYHLMMICSVILCLFNPLYGIAFLFLFFIKCVADLMLLFKASRLFDVQIKFFEFIQLQLMYLFYVLRMGWNLLLGKRGDWV